MLVQPGQCGQNSAIFLGVAQPVRRVICTVGGAVCADRGDGGFTEQVAQAKGACHSIVGIADRCCRQAADGATAWNGRLDGRDGGEWVDVECERAAGHNGGSHQRGREIDQPAARFVVVIVVATGAGEPGNDDAGVDADVDGVFPAGINAGNAEDGGAVGRINRDQQIVGAADGTRHDVAGDNVVGDDWRTGYYGCYGRTGCSATACVQRQCRGSSKEPNAESAFGGYIGHQTTAQISDGGG